MQNTLTLEGGIALFGVMALLAAIPSVSVLIVSTRAMSGFIHGVFAALGIVAGDIFYILLAIFGLSILVEAMGDLFVFVKYLGGIYLVWLGVVIWKSRIKPIEAEQADGDRPPSMLSSFLAGFFITLADQKAVLFYLGLLPAFLDLSTVTWIDVGIVLAITVVAVGGVKVAYAYTADRAAVLVSAGVRRGINRVAGGILMAVGIFLMVKT